MDSFSPHDFRPIPALRKISREISCGAVWCRCFVFKNRPFTVLSQSVIMTILLCINQLSIRQHYSDSVHAPVSRCGSPENVGTCVRILSFGSRPACWSLVFSKSKSKKVNFKWVVGVGYCPRATLGGLGDRSWRSGAKHPVLFEPRHRRGEFTGCCGTSLRAIPRPHSCRRRRPHPHVK